MIRTKCTISTPQFKDGKAWYYHIQEGKFNFLTKRFTPNDRLNGNHTVQFRSVADFRKSKIG